jgi:hypothetical protein
LQGDGKQTHKCYAIPNVTILGVIWYQYSQNIFSALYTNLPVYDIAGLWIRIRIGSGFSDFVDPDPYWESGSRGKKIKKF